MDNYITCPHCNKTISNDPLIEDAANKEGSSARAISCDCGERITFWQITAQLRDQKTFRFRFRGWLKDTFRR
jgi:hypothetical protein